MFDLYVLVVVNGNFDSQVEHMVLQAISRHAERSWCHDNAEKHVTTLLWLQSQMQWHFVEA